MDGNRALASWLIAQRKPIEAAMVAQLGPAAPAASSPEAEALRRFRTFASSALLRGEAASPALDGLRVPERRTIALIEAWVGAAASVAREEGPALCRSLEPLVDQFRLALRSTRTSRRSSAIYMSASMGTRAGCWAASSAEDFSEISISYPSRLRMGREWETKTSGRAKATILRRGDSCNDIAAISAPRSPQFRHLRLT